MAMLFSSFMACSLMALSGMDGEPNVEFALLLPSTLPENDEVMRPGQLSHQWRDNWVFSVELSHSEQVSATKPTQAGLSCGNKACESVHGTVAPLGCLDLAADGRSDFPI